MADNDDSENLSDVANAIVAATRDLPRSGFDDVLRRYTHVLSDDQKAGIVAGHINAAIGGPVEAHQQLREMLQRHAHEDVEVTVSEAEVALADADLRHAIDGTTFRPKGSSER